LHDGAGHVTAPVLALFTPDSRRYLVRAGQEGLAEVLLDSTATTLDHGGQSSVTPGLVVGGDPEDTVFLVRDGHANLIDLALSGVTFADLRGPTYPAPW